MHTEKKNTQKELKKMKMKRKWKEKGREHRSSQWDSKRVHLRKKISTVSGGGPGPRVPPPLAAPLQTFRPNTIEAFTSFATDRITCRWNDANSTPSKSINNEAG
jgi:hypothetical protein